MTEFQTDRPGKGINIEPVRESKTGCTITDLTSQPVYGGYRASYSVWIHGCMSRIAGVFISVKQCSNEANLKSYLESL